MTALFARCGLAAAVTVSACAGPESETSTLRSALASEPRVVVALIDTGINPYHDIFHRDGPVYANSVPSSVTPGVLAEFGVDAAHTIRLTRTGDFAADFAADQAAVWDQVRRGEIYWFEGTNILAVSFDPEGIPILADPSVFTANVSFDPENRTGGHGTGTSGVLLHTHPDAVLLFVEGMPYPNATAREHFGPPTDSERFAFNHPGVDIVSTSYGLPASPPFLTEAITDSYVGVVTLGKLHFGAAANSPQPDLLSGTPGPWWSIGVSGLQGGESEGRELLAGSLADFVADYARSDLAYCEACESETESHGGTSFSTPTAAGVASQVLLAARRALGHAGGIRIVDGRPFMAVKDGIAITNWQLRRALEQAAHVPRTADYNASGAAGGLGIGVPVIDAAPWLLVGWGELSPQSDKAVVANALAHLGLGGTAAPAKDAAFCTWQTQLIFQRKLYWDQLNPASPSNGALPPQDPFIYCGSAPSASSTPRL